MAPSIMPEYCSCGAQLPPDARFCHKCGKPQSALTATDEPPEAAPPKPAPAFEAVRLPEPSFHNPVAVRVGLGMASLAALLSTIPVLSLGSLIWWIAAGFFSVFVYRRRTGQFLNVRAGLRLGWITGVLTSAIMTVLLTLSFLSMTAAPGGFSGWLQQQIRGSIPAGDPRLQDFMRLLENPAVVASILLMFLLAFFVMITLLATVGGALGAKVAGRSE